MKKLLLIGTLAALGPASLLAVPVSATFDGSHQGPSASLTFTTTDGNITVYGRTYNTTTGWVNSTNTSLVQSRASIGVGVDSQVGPDTGWSVERDGTASEWLYFDFGATSLGGASIDSITVYYPNLQPISSPYFYYGWTTTVPTTGLNPDPASTYTSMTNVWPAAPGAQTATFTTLTGSGRYFVIGAQVSEPFSVKSLTFTPAQMVPDGASTLALMGAAIASLGLAARRRKA